MNLPQDFLHIMEEQIGKDETESLCASLSSAPSVSIRVNKKKMREDLFEDMSSLVSEKVKWCDDGYYLSERPSFTLDPLFHAGAYYVQEASSMFIHHVIKKYIDEPVVALDLCAAPGGKSTLALSALPEGSVLVANEIVRQRCQVLAENIIKWGCPDVIVTNNASEDFTDFQGCFDLVICDAPCSGEGMFRKDEKAVEEWSMRNVDMCWQRQHEIVSNIWKCVRPGGILVYSTCTFNHLEDEDMVRWMCEDLGAERLPLLDDSEWAISDGHFFPHKVRGEGFFVCPVRKPEDADDVTVEKERKTKGKNKDKDHDVVGNNSAYMPELRRLLNNPENMTFFAEDNDFVAFPTKHLDVLRRARKSLRIVSYGVKIATLKGKKMQPEHGLAMSTEMNDDCFHSVDLTLEDALAYLRAEAITVDAPKGYVALKYKGLTLGFGNNVGNRVNNLYPSEWKIRKKS